MSNRIGSRVKLALFKSSSPVDDVKLGKDAYGGLYYWWLISTSLFE